MPLLPDQKFSTFQVGGSLVDGDIVVGLRGGLNTRFTWADGALSIEGTQYQVLVNGTSGTPQTGDIVLTTPQDIAPTSSPTFNNLELDGVIYGGNGLTVLGFESIASAVNYINVQNSITGVAPGLRSAGSDTDIGMNFTAKAAGRFTYYSTSTGIVQNVYSGSGYAHLTRFTYPSTSATRDVTWQDASGTVAYLSDVLGTVTSITGTQDQVLANGNFGTLETGAVTLTTPQDIATTSTPTFLGVTAGNLNLLGNTLSSTDTNGNISFVPNGTGKATFFSGTSWNNIYDQTIQSLYAYSRARYNAGDGQNTDSFQGMTSRATGPGLWSASNVGDVTCKIRGFVDDGTQWVPVGQMFFQLTSASSTGIAPGGWVLSTTNLSGVMTAAMAVGNDQKLTLTHPLEASQGGTGVTSSTGSGSVVLNTSPTLVTPTLGVASATSINFGGSALSSYVSRTAFTPTFTAATPGDISVSYSTQVGWYRRIGDMVFFQINLICTPTFTTASGNLLIAGLPVAPSVIDTPIPLNQVSGFTWPAGRTFLTCAVTSASRLVLVSSGSAVAPSVLTTTAIVSGAAITIYCAGSYFV